MAESNSEEIFEVHWEGPFSSEDIDEYLNDTKNEELSGNLKKYWVLYAAYGSHQLYGSDVFLYLGKTKRGVDKRLIEHDQWFNEGRFGDSRYFLASICNFTSWAESPDTDDYSDSNRFLSGEDNRIELIEKLMIYALSPAWNTRERKSPPKKSQNIRIFNHGALGSFPHEISGKYWIE